MKNVNVTIITLQYNYQFFYSCFLNLSLISSSVTRKQFGNFLGDII
jgi:hypothetical protein